MHKLWDLSDELRAKSARSAVVPTPEERKKSTVRQGFVDKRTIYFNFKKFALELLEGTQGLPSSDADLEIGCPM